MHYVHMYPGSQGNTFIHSLFQSSLNDTFPCIGWNKMITSIETCLKKLYVYNYIKSKDNQFENSISFERSEIN